MKTTDHFKIPYPETSDPLNLFPDQVAKPAAEQVDAALFDISDSLSKRISVVESLGGLSPESPTDLATAALIDQAGSATHEAVTEVTRKAIGTSGVNYLLSRSAPQTFHLPEDFNFPLDIVAARSNSGDWTVNIDPKSFHRAGPGGTVFIDPSSGNDVTATQGTESDPYLTYAYAKVKNPTTSEFVYLSDAVVERSAYSARLNPGTSVRAIPGARVKLVCGDKLAWSPSGASTFTAPIASLTGVAVVEVDNIQPLKETSNDVLSPGEYKFASGTVEICLDSGMSISDVFVLRSVNSLIANATTAGDSFYLENLTFVGGTTCNFSAAAIGAGLYAKDCKFLHMQVTNGLSVRGFEEVILVDCEASDSYLDGFNYHEYNGLNGHVVEVRCIGERNGKTSGSQNGSTAHEAYRVVRIGGVYRDNAGANVAEVGISQSVNVGCAASGSWDYMQDFYTGANALMWLIECLASSEKGIVAADNSTVFTRVSAVMGTTLISGNGAINDF